LPDSTGAPTPGRTRTPPCAPACPDTNQYDLAADTRAYALPDGTSRADKLQHQKTPHRDAPPSYQPVVPAVDNHHPTTDLAKQPVKRTTPHHLSTKRTEDLASILRAGSSAVPSGPTTGTRNGRHTGALRISHDYCGVFHLTGLRPREAT
jgi:hypothetical protein